MSRNFNRTTVIQLRMTMLCKHRVCVHAPPKAIRVCLMQINAKDSILRNFFTCEIVLW